MSVSAAILRNAAGEAFMVRYDPRRELASRDIVARAIATEMAQTGRPDDAHSREPGLGLGSRGRGRRHHGFRRARFPGARGYMLRGWLLCILRVIDSVLPAALKLGQPPQLRLLPQPILLAARADDATLMKFRSWN